MAGYNAGETLHGLSKRHDVRRNLIRVWIAKAEAGAFNDDAAAAELLATCEARIAALDADAALVAEMRAITDAWECYGYRRIGAELRRTAPNCAELRHCGWVVNGKKVRRLMRLHDVNPRRRRRFLRTTDSDHDGPIWSLIAKGFETHAPDQFRVGDITFVAIASGFVDVAIVLDAWSRRVVGYGIGRRIDARRPAVSCIRIADRSTPRSSTGRSSPGAAPSAR